MAQKVIKSSKISKEFSLIGTTGLITLTEELAVKYRDMESFKRERSLSPTNSKLLWNAIVDGKFTTNKIASCIYRGVEYRMNGNHTCHIVAAAIQNSYGTLEEDDKSLDFVNKFLIRGQGEYRLNKISEMVRAFSPVKCYIETYEAYTEQGMIDLYATFDNPSSARDRVHKVAIQSSRYPQLATTNASNPILTRFHDGLKRVVLQHTELFGMSASDKEYYEKSKNRCIYEHDGIPELLNEVLCLYSKSKVYLTNKLLNSAAGCGIITYCYKVYGEDGLSEIFDYLSKKLIQLDVPGTDKNTCEDIWPKYMKDFVLNKGGKSNEKILHGIKVINNVAELLEISRENN